MISQTKKTFLNGLLMCIGSLRAKRRLLKMGCIILFMGVHSSYCVEYAPETPVDYYKCISGACTNTIPNLRGLKNTYDLTMTPVKNQNPLGTCTTFTVGGCVEYRSKEYNRTGSFIYFPVSEAEFTVYAEQHTPGGNCRQGLNLGEALKAAKERGFIHEDYWSYPQYIEEVRGLNELTEEDEIDSLANICITNKYTERELSRIPKIKLNDIRVISHISRQSILTAFSRETQRAPVKSSNRSTSISFQSPHSNDDSIIPTIKAYIQKYKAPVAISVATFENWGNDAYIKMPTLEIAQQWNDLHLPRSTALFSRDRYDNYLSSPSVRFGSGSYPYDYYDDTDGSSLTFTPSGWDYNKSKDKYGPYPFSSSFRPHGVVYDDTYFSSTFSKQTLSQNWNAGTYKEGWHAIILTGFDDDSNAFKFKNSWGEHWGDGGYGWLPYDYVKLYASELVATF